MFRVLQGMSASLTIIYVSFVHCKFLLFVIKWENSAFVTRENCLKGMVSDYVETSVCFFGTYGVAEK